MYLINFNINSYILYVITIKFYFYSILTIDKLLSFIFSSNKSIIPKYFISLSIYIIAKLLK